MNKVDWNDLRYVIAVVEQGSAAAAAKVLGVSHATVLRRVQFIEKIIGSPLFERLPTGYVVTEAGATLTRAGQDIESIMNDAQRQISGRKNELSGTIRFTTTDSLGLSVLPPLLASFQELYPLIKIEVHLTNSILDLDKHEADITLRPSAKPPEAWVGKRLARMDFGVYASIAYASARPNIKWDENDWIFPEGTLAMAPSGVWLQSVIATERSVLKANSFLMMSALVQQGRGVALLPRFVAQNAANLCLLHPAPKNASVDVWVLTHPTLKHSAKISVFINHLSSGIRTLRGLFEIE